MLPTPAKALLLTTAIAAAAPVAAASAADPAPSTPATAPGAVLQSTKLTTDTAAAVRATVRKAHMAAGGVTNGVTTYRLRYATTGVDGKPTTATTLLAVPAKAGTLKLLAYEHGTNVDRHIAPSVETDSDARTVALLLAGGGYATVAPDYLGLGLGPGHHPYLDPTTEASASIDALRAAKAFAASRKLSLSDDVRVTGFSQGGQAAMATARALQQQDDPQLKLSALAPFSGPYDLSGAELPAILDGRLAPQLGAFNLSYALVSWQQRFHVYRSPKDIWRDPALPGLFDGNHDEGKIFAALPKRLDQTFTPAALKALRTPTGALKQAIDSADGTCDWKPAVPTLLLAARGDDAVAYANSEHCRDDLRRAGATDVTLTDLGKVDHFTSEALAAPRVLSYLKQIDRGR